MGFCGIVMRKRETFMKFGWIADTFASAQTHNLELNLIFHKILKRDFFV